MACRGVVRQAGPFACYAEGFRQFVTASRWLGENVPDGSARVQPKTSHLVYTFGCPKPDIPAELRSGAFFP